MQHYINQQLVTRNHRMSRMMMFGGLGASIVAVIITFARPAWLIFAFGLILVGGVISQVGTAIHNRFGRSPRIDEVIDFSLKGLDNRHAIFHYHLGTNHALFTPQGAYAIVPMLEKGSIEYADGMWKHQPPRGRFSLGNPKMRPLRQLTREAKRETTRLQRYLQKRVPKHADLEVEPLALFLANDMQVRAEGAPFIAVHRKKLKETLRKTRGQASFTEEDIQQLAQFLNLREA